MASIGTRHALVTYKYRQTLIHKKLKNKNSHTKNHEATYEIRNTNQQ